MTIRGRFRAANWMDSGARAPESNWLISQGRSLYFPAGRDRNRRGPRISIKTTLTSSKTHSRLVSPMRELEREDLSSPRATPLIVVGNGRVGRSLSAASERAGIEVTLFSHGEPSESIPAGAAVLLCVPDEAIAATAEHFAAGAHSWVGHVSGATTLDALAAAAERGAGAFSLHP